MNIITPIKNYRTNTKISLRVAEIRMLWWMCGKIRWDRIKMTEKVVVNKVEKMV